MEIFLPSVIRPYSIIFMQRSKGTLFAALCAELLFLRMFHVADLEARDSIDGAVRWLKNSTESLNANPFLLNIAGPRESESSGIYVAAQVFLSELFDRF
jgi:hypothetical protein